MGDDIARFEIEGVPRTFRSIVYTFCSVEVFSGKYSSQTLADAGYGVYEKFPVRYLVHVPAGSSYPVLDSK